MVDYHYDDNLPKTMARWSRLKIAIISLLLLVLLITGYILVDSIRSKSSITQIQPTTSTLGSLVEQKIFDEKGFKFIADTTWERIPPVDDRYNAFRYRSITQGLVKRQFTVYVNSFPGEYPVPYVLPIEISGNKLTPLAVSPNCTTFQPDKKNKRDVQLSWAGVSFLCDPDSGISEVAASHNKTGYKISLSSKSGQNNKFFFVYRDDEPIPKLGIFNELLLTFEAK